MFLGVPFNRVHVTSKRVGNSFGGKGIRNIPMLANSSWRDWPPFVLLQEVTRPPGRWWWGWPLAAGSTSLLWVTTLSHQNKEPALIRSARRVDGGGTIQLERRALLSRSTFLQGSTPSSALMWWLTLGRPSTLPSTSPTLKRPSLKDTAGLPWRIPCSAQKESYSQEGTASTT